jgi:transcription initiation factor TFIIE subunit alpha
MVRMKKLEYEDSFVKVAGLLGGEEYVRVARALLNNENATDEEIASATGLKINVVRRVLYDLFGKSLISGIRVRDPKRGWHVYQWKAQPDQVETFLNNKKRKILLRLRARLEYEKSHTFYYCGTLTCRKRTFEEAMELFFRCPECGNSLVPYDNSRLIDALDQKIRQLEEELKGKKS